MRKIKSCLPLLLCRGHGCFQFVKKIFRQSAQAWPAGKVFRRVGQSRNARQVENGEDVAAGWNQDFPGFYLLMRLAGSIRGGNERTVLAETQDEHRALFGARTVGVFARRETAPDDVEKLRRFHRKNDSSRPRAFICGVTWMAPELLRSV